LRIEIRQHPKLFRKEAETAQQPNNEKARDTARIPLKQPSQ